MVPLVIAAVAVLLAAAAWARAGRVARKLETMTHHRLSHGEAVAIPHPHCAAAVMAKPSKPPAVPG